MIRGGLFDSCVEKVGGKFNLVVCVSQFVINAYYISNSDGADGLIDESIKKIASDDFDFEKVRVAVSNRFSGGSSFFNSPDEQENREESDTNVGQITFENFISEDI